TSVQTGKRTAKEQGQELFKKWVQAMHICTLFQHPAFSEDLIRIAGAFVNECIRGVATGELGTSFSGTRIKAGVQHFLQCPLEYEKAAKKELEILLKEEGKVIGASVAQALVQALSDCKEVLSGPSTKKNEERFETIAKAEASCGYLADGKFYASVPGLAQDLG